MSHYDESELKYEFQTYLRELESNIIFEFLNRLDSTCGKPSDVEHLFHDEAQAEIVYNHIRVVNKDAEYVASMLLDIAGKRADAKWKAAMLLLGLEE